MPSLVYSINSNCSWQQVYREMSQGQGQVSADLEDVRDKEGLKLLVGCVDAQLLEPIEAR